MQIISDKQTWRNRKQGDETTLQVLLLFKYRRNELVKSIRYMLFTEIPAQLQSNIAPTASSSVSKNIRTELPHEIVDIDE